MAKQRAIPPVPSRDPLERQFFEALKELVEVGDGVRGDPLDRKLTVRDLLDIGLGKLRSGVSRSGYILPSAIEPIAGSEKPSLATPPAPTGLVATKGIGMVFLVWDSPTYSNHAHANIYRSTDDNFANAALLTSSIGQIYADRVPYEVIDLQTGAIRGYYYWVTFVSDAGIEGPPNSVSGTYQTPEAEPQYLLDSINSVLSNPQSGASFQTVADNFAVVDSGTGNLILGTFNGVAVINGAFITNLTVKNEQVENLSVDKLTGDTGAFVVANIGDAAIGTAKLADLLQSTNYSPTTGWAIYKSGAMVLNDVYARGDIEATTIKAGSVNIVDTLMIQGQAVTFSTTSQTIGATAISTTDSNVATHVFVLDQTTNVQVSFVGQVMVDDNSTSRVGRVQAAMYIKKDGVVVATLYPYIYVTSTTLDTSYASVSLVGVTSLSAGTYTVLVDMKRVDGAPAASASYRTINVLALKR